jgi:hypothetical protein
VILIAAMAVQQLVNALTRGLSLGFIYKPRSGATPSSAGVLRVDQDSEAAATSPEVSKHGEERNLECSADA